MRQDSLCNIMAHSLRGRPTLRMYLLVAASNETGEKAKLRRKSESGDLAIRPQLLLHELLAERHLASAFKNDRVGSL